MKRRAAARSRGQMLMSAVSTARLLGSNSHRLACVHSLLRFSTLSPPSRPPPASAPPSHPVLSLRRALPSDESFILQLANRLSDFPVPPWRLPEHINRADDAIMLADLHKPLPANFFVVAERQPAGAERLRAGFAFASSRTDYFTGQLHAHVEAMAVAKEQEGAGVAAALLQACEEWARSRGDEFVTLNVWAQNNRARDVYNRLGWLPETVHMRKALK